MIAVYVAEAKSSAGEKLYHQRLSASHEAAKQLTHGLIETINQSDFNLP